MRLRIENNRIEIERVRRRKGVDKESNAVLRDPRQPRNLAQGWKAVTDHGPLSGLGNFDKDRWSLFHTDEDRAEAP
jgi:hypothetical protein